jgi:hypothetical protein
MDAFIDNKEIVYLRNSGQNKKYLKSNDFRLFSAILFFLGN